MKLTHKLRKSLIIAMAMTAAVTTVYATPVLNSRTILQPEVEQGPRITVPEIIGVDSTSLMQGEEFEPLSGVYAFDYQNKNITDSIVVEGTVNTEVPGIYYVTYTATDALGVQGVYKRGVAVKAVEEPIIDGLVDIHIETTGGFGAMRGVKAYDMYGTDITNTVKIKSEFNIHQPGQYPIEYTAVDAQGNVGRGVRMLTVKDEITPTTQPPYVASERPLTLKVGDTFNFTDGISIMEPGVGDQTPWARIIGEVDTTTPGTYTVRYIVVGRSGLVLVHDRLVTVVA